MGYFYALKDLDWPWDDQDEGRAIIVEADTPEGAIKIATERHIKQFPGAGGVTWSVARVDDFGFGDAEWSDDNIPAYEPFKNYHDVTESLGSQIDRLANFIMAEIERVTNIQRNFTPRSTNRIEAEALLERMEAALASPPPVAEGKAQPVAWREAMAVCDAFDVLSLSEAYGGSGATSVSSKDLNALDKAVKALRAALSSVPGKGWQNDMDSAPKGEIVNVVGRYKHATAGYPRYAGFNEATGEWVEYTKHEPEPIVVWAWRPRDDWPMEPVAASPKPSDPSSPEGAGQ